jgi:triacylglycerol lipase
VKAKTFGVLVLLLGGLLGSGSAALPGWGNLMQEHGSTVLVPLGSLRQDRVREAVQDEGRDRRPVLLVPGWLGRLPELSALRDRFLRDGWAEWEVLALEFVDPVGSNLEHARELEDALQHLLSQTGAREVDILAHSMGGLAVWLLLQERGDLLPIRRVVFLGSPLQGTVVAHLAWGEGGREMRPGSEFLDRLQAGGQPQNWVEALTIRTPLDLNVVPGHGATLPGLGDRLVCCPTHQGLLDHEETYRVARSFLERGR